MDATFTADDTATDDGAALARVLRNLPGTMELSRLVQSRLREIVGDGRTARARTADDGEAPLGPDRVRNLTLQLVVVQDVLHGIAQAFEAGSKAALQYLGEEQIEAMGEQQGLPNGSLSVLADDGATVKVYADTVRQWQARDLSVILDAAATVGIAERAEQLVGVGVEDSPEVGTVLHEMVVHALTTLVGSGKFEPQTTKVKGLADRAARIDADVAEAARGTMYVTTRSRGTKVERTEPK